MDEAYWSMQWCGEVLPEPAMIPDLRVFLRSVPAEARAVTVRVVRGQSHRAPVQSLDETTRRRRSFPARLNLPFLLSSAGEKALTVDETHHR